MGLLREAEEEFGFQHEGTLRIPYDIQLFGANEGGTTRGLT
jgi:hypothetical protein